MKALGNPSYTTARQADPRAAVSAGSACIIDDTNHVYSRESTASTMRSALAAKSESHAEARVATDGSK